MSIRTDSLGKVGPTITPDGQPVNNRYGRDNALVVQDGHAPYQEPVLRGVSYTATTQIATATGAGLSTTIASLALWNPPTSGVNCVIWHSEALCTVFPALALIALCAIPGMATAPTGNTQFTPRNNGTFNTGGGKAIAYLTGTLPVTPVYLRSILNSLSASSPAFVFSPTINGQVSVAPGNGVVIQSNASVTGFYTLVWEEVPL